MLPLTASKSTEVNENQPLSLNLIQQPVSVAMKILEIISLEEGKVDSR